MRDRRLFRMQAIGLLLVPLSVVLVGWASACHAQLLRWEGDFSGDLDLSTSDQPTPLTGRWVYEIDRRDLQPVFPGASTMTSSGPPTTLEISPGGWGSTTFAPAGVGVLLQLPQGQATPSFTQIGWGMPNGLESWRDDFALTYVGDQLQTIRYSEAVVPSIPQATNVAGSLRRVEPDPYLMGEFSGSFPDSYGLGDFSGRWAIDLDDLQLPPSTTAFRPLRYLKITSEYPGSESFVLKDTQAWVVMGSDGELQNLMIGLGLPNSIRNWEDDFSVLYTLADGLTSASDLVSSPRIQVSSAQDFNPIVSLTDTTGSLTLVPEPTSLLIFAGAAALVIARRRT